MKRGRDGQKKRERMSGKERKRERGGGRERKTIGRKKKRGRGEG